MNIGYIVYVNECLMCVTESHNIVTESRNIVTETHTFNFNFTCLICREFSNVLPLYYLPINISTSRIVLYNCAALIFVAAYTAKILEFIKLSLPTVDTVQIWTDGPSSQYKIKFVFILSIKLKEVSDLQLQWNYFATSHGKGPNDARWQCNANCPSSSVIQKVRNKRCFIIFCCC